MKKDQIFISYRRNGGEAMAQLIHDKLVEKGYRVFYDIESLKSGPFDSKLYEKIEECDDFLLILPPQALDRCIYDEDWVRCEIRHAIKHKKNIIPILMRGFVFPQDLPEDIQAVSRLNGVEFETMEYLDARIAKIISMMECKSNAPENGEYKDRKKDSDLYIKNVCSYCSCDFNNPFPNDGYYSEVFDRDRFNVIYFHISTNRIHAKKIYNKMVIYDDKDNKVFEDEGDVDWRPDYDRISKSWIIKGSDGSFVRSGMYRAEFSVNGSSYYEYYFKVVSGQNGGFGQGSSQKRPDDKSAKELNKKITDEEKRRSRPKGLLRYFLLILSVGIFMASAQSENVVIPLVMMVLMLIFWIRLFTYTRRYVCKNIIGAFLLTTIVTPYYGIYLLVTAIMALTNK